MIDVTDDTFGLEVAAEEGHVLIDFWAPWCAPCIQLGKILHGLESSYPDVKFVRINTDENPTTAERYGVVGLPKVVLTSASGDVILTQYTRRAVMQFLEENG